MRLIDVSDEHIKEILSPVPYYPDEIWKFTAMTKRFPTVDAVEVVRCRDCRFAHRVDSKYEAYDCAKAAYTAPWFGADEFCSRGERRCDE